MPAKLIAKSRLTIGNVFNAKVILHDSVFLR